MLLIDRRMAILTVAFGATALGAMALAPSAQSVGVQAKIGAPAPTFTVTDSNGKQVSLADFKGKTVVLEWTNDQCPFVQKHYNATNMQKLQKKWTGDGVVWLTIIASVPAIDCRAAIRSRSRSASASSRPYRLAKVSYLMTLFCSSRMP